MKTLRYKIALLLLVFTLTIAHSQEKSAKQKQLETFLESREFVFTPTTAIPQGMKSVSLSSGNYYFKVHLQSLEAYLPYYGRAYSGMPYGGDSGIQFNAEPTEYKLVKNKNNYEILATVKGNNDIYRVNLSVGFEGDATLHISSNKKSSISYYGILSPAENKIEDGK